MNNDIAVVGMAARLPDAATVAQYWRNLVGGVESVRPLTDEQLLAAGVARRQLADPRYVKSAVVLDGFDQFDAEFFGFSPKEAAIMDPQHRQFLECAWEALEDAAHPPQTFGGPIGVFAGCGMGAYFALNVLRNRKLMEEVGLFLLRHTGNDKDFLATRASYCFDLRGPSVNVQTACSTSLVAIHLAGQSLLARECDMALAGGVTIEMPHGRGYTFTEGEILSPDGKCRAFDHRSRGTVFGSGAGVVVLRRLEDALADKDHVYAVIKGSAVNNDGARKVGYLAPSVDGQAAAIAEALALAGVEPQDVGYVECHGTGTEIGDPIEVSALTQAFAGGPRKQWCGIGSVKTNIGHLDTAAGVASFIKACLALQHGQLPPTLHYEAPNPLIDFANSPFYVNAALKPWPRGPKPRYAGVTSLGVGGTNAHVVVGEAPAPVAAPARPAAGPFVLAWSARNVRSLDDYARKLAAWLRERPEADLRDVAGTLAHGRAALPRRRLLVCADRDEAIRLLEGEDPRRLHTHAATEGGAKVVFLLPGGGAQHRRMGQGLYATEPVFREHVDRGLQLLQGQLDVDLREVWFGDAMSDADAEAAFDRPSVQLPAIFLCEHALAKVWEQKGVKPAALLGHSLGENTAACLAGVMSFADCLRLVTLRGKLFERVRGGGMLSVPLSAEECRKRLGPDLDLATVNAPGLCVVSGPDTALDAFAARLRQEDLETQRVRIAIAAHSRLLEPILADFGAFLRGIELRKPAIPFLSNRTGTWITDAQATDPEYWVAHLRNTVRFAEGVDALMRDPKHVFLEVGPGRALSSLARQHPSWSAERSAIASLRHPDEKVADAAYFLGARARLWAAGVDVPLAELVPTDFQRLPLPTYAFRRQRYWVDPDPEGAAPEAASDRVDDVGKWRWTPAWRRADLPAGAAPAAGAWLVFCDVAGVGQRAAALLRARGLDVVEAHVGDAYGKIGPGKYALSPELGRDGYDALLRDLAADGKELRGALHCWLATADRSFRPGSSFFHRCEEQGFYSLLFLAQALGAEEPAGPFRLVVLVNGLGGPGEAASSPEKALAVGPCLVAPRELPQVRCALVDVPMPDKARGKAAAAALDAAAAAGVAELAAEDDGRFAWRDGARWRREHEPRELAPARPGLPARLRERGCYLVTGGLGGVGSLVGEWLARACKARLVLVGRRELPPRERWDAHVAAHGADDATSRLIQKVRALESAGAEVFVGAADVADVVQMRAVVAAARQRFGPIHGVFHAAGVLDDALIAGKEQASVERVLAPKVQGALVLEECLGAEPLDFTVLFSSTSATIGPPGQVDYVAANAFLDAHAQRRSAAGKPTVAVQWGAWNRVGMTAVDAAEVAAGGRPQPIKLPLFHEMTVVGAEERVLVGRLSSATHWLLDEHRTKDGRAVVPGTGYLEMAAEALEAIGERGPFEARDLWFFRPLHVADGASCEVRVRLRATIEGYEFAVMGETALPDGQRGWQTHVEARLLLRAMTAPKPLDLAAVRAGCRDVRAPGAGGWIPSPQEAHLRFGPRWRVVRELRYGQGVAVAGIALAAEFAAEAERFRLHPAALDLATGFAMELVPGYDPSRLHVPLAYRSVRAHAPLPPRYVSVATRVQAVGAGGDIVAVDLSLCDEDGRVLVEVEGFQMKRLAAEQQFGAPPAAARGDAASARGGSAATQLLAANIEKGILPSEGMDALARVLAGDLQPEQMVSPVPLPGLLADLAKAQAPAAAGAGRFARPELDNEYVAPRDEVESTLVRFVEGLLGIDSVGVQDDFFALGGHSLVAVRLFARVKKQFRVDYPMSVLFEAPTVERLAAMLKRDGVAGADAAAPVAEAAPRHRYRHLVAMHPSKHGDGRPFFLVAGMFGNVLNLRHLAQLCGGDRPFYGLQARGLFGDMAPHATFEEAARDYVAELRLVQPHGPYLLGGFSGGGITAFEMCRQLRAAGEQVELLVLLDTPLPTKGVVGRADRLRIQWQRLRKQGPAYLWRWLRNRVAWEVGRLRRRFGGGVEAPETTATFHSQAIEAAFREALGCYRVEPSPVRTWLFRPALDRTYDLGGGRFANKDRELVLPDNGWTAFLADLTVVETPGDHDSMVLEPNVRSMAARLREALVSAAGRGGAAAP